MLGTDLGTVTKVETMVSGNDGVVSVREDLCRDVVSNADAFTAVEAVFAAMAAGDAVNFPVVREAIGHADTLYGIKSGFDRAGMALGVKSGGYLPQNVTNVGISNHQWSVCLFDPDTGRLQAVIGGNYLIAVRTAAADVIITITSSNQPLLMADHVTPGTYVVAMGADRLVNRKLTQSCFLTLRFSPMKWLNQ